VKHKTIRIDYRLPITVARFTGTTTTTTDPLAPEGEQRTVARSGAVAVDVRADHRSLCSIEIAEPDIDKLKTSFQLLEDGRLAGMDAALESRGGQRITAVLSSGSGAGAAALALGAAPLGAALAGVAVGASAWLTLRARKGLDVGTVELGEGVQPEDDNSDLPDASELGINPLFQEAMPADHERLYRYRLGLLRLTLAHAEAAADAASQPDVASRRLAALDLALASCRAEAQRAEDVYEAWARSKRETTVEHHHWQLFVDQLPTEAELIREVTNPDQDKDDSGWWRVATGIGAMVTCDILATPAADAPTQTVFSFDDGTIIFRPPMLAALANWSFHPDTRVPAGWIAKKAQTEWILVTHPVTTRTIHVPFISKSNALTKVTFSAAGALESFSSEVAGRLGERAQLIGGFPTLVRDAAKTGSEVAGSFSPAAARAAALKRRVDEIEARNKLQGLVNPSMERLADLKAELAEAELQAKLGAVRHMIGDPTSAVVIAGEAE